MSTFGQAGQDQDISQSQQRGLSKQGASISDYCQRILQISDARHMFGEAGLDEDISNILQSQQQGLSWRGASIAENPSDGHGGLEEDRDLLARTENQDPMEGHAAGNRDLDVRLDPWKLPQVATTVSGKE